MRYKLLGRSGLKVSELCLGTMTFGEEWGFGASKASERILSARYQLLPKKDAATRPIPPGIMDHASCRKFRSSFSTEVTERG
jgi:hypothetical protein